MPRSCALERLTEHQNAILAIMASAEPMLGDEARDVAGLARARWSVMRALTAYQLFKHRELFDPRLARATPAEAHKLLLLKRACTEMGDAFRRHVQQWSAADVNACWATYQPAARAMIARIRTHLAREREAMTALLAQE